MQRLYVKHESAGSRKRVNTGQGEEGGGDELETTVWADAEEAGLAGAGIGL